VETLELTAAGSRAVVVLGASNVSRGLARLSAIVRARAAVPVSLFVAAGHGRGYGVNTRVALRRLPSILDCGLWRTLDRERIERPMVVVTDVGNELLYGLGVSAVAGAVREATHRLASRGGHLVIMGLPLAAIAGVGAVRYRLLRTFYVPRCLLGLDELKEATCWLDEELRALAVETGATFIEQPAAWYGLDALHVRRPRLDALWQRVCDAWGLPCTTVSPRATWSDWAAIGLQGAEVRSLARAMRFTPQPVVTRHDLRVWMY
jgi:hypothetical protein